MVDMNKICPQCNKIIKFKTISQFNESVNKNRTCKSCALKKRRYSGSLSKQCTVCNKNYTFSTFSKYNKSKNPYVCKPCSLSIYHKGKSISEEQKIKQKEKMLGRHLSDETRKKLSEKRKGKNNPCYGRCGNKNPMFNKSGILSPTYGKPSWNRGKLMSDEARKNMRIAKLKRFEKLGIQAGEDEGAKEWFEFYNKNTNSNFKPKRFLEIGYDADGYDEEKHIWVEYDTPYHLKPKQLEKDLKRQQNIIEYFKKIGNPLNKFLRVDSRTKIVKISYDKPKL
jgi:hypothetical protein